MQKADTTVLKESSPEDDEDKEKRLKAWKRMKLSLIFMGSFFTIFGIYSFYILGKLFKRNFTHCETSDYICQQFIGVLPCLL